MRLPTRELVGIFLAAEPRMPRAKPTVLSLQTVKAEDTPFLQALYAETRSPDLEATGWPPEAREAFYRGQFDAQARSYRRQYPDASFDLVLAEGKPVGRLYVARGADAVRVVEITLLPSCRQRGWGTLLLRRVIEEAHRLGLPVRLQVDAGSRARRLYQRLGFRETGREGFRLDMERPAGPLPA